MSRGLVGRSRSNVMHTMSRRLILGDSKWNIGICMYKMSCRKIFGECWGILL
jgi:hypothetical protein